MRKALFALFLMTLIYPLESRQIAPSSQDEKKNEEIVFFTPPSGWSLADSNILPNHVKVMVVGKGPSSFPPSLNLSCEPYQGTLKQYLKIIKNINEAKNYEWKDLGSIQTEAGLGNLSQVDTKTQWGDVRLMHVILIKNGVVYILTASALKNEFSIFYRDFFNSMRSLRVLNDVYEMIVNSKERDELKKNTAEIQAQWQILLIKKQQENPETDLTELQENLFKSEEFQNSIWKPFKEKVQRKYNQLPVEWHSIFSQKIENLLFSMKPQSM